MNLADIVPYDPESPKGREVAADLTRVLADLEAAVNRREATATSAVFVEAREAA